MFCHFGQIEILITKHLIYTTKHIYLRAYPPQSIPLHRNTQIQRTSIKCHITIHHLRTKNNSNNCGDINNHHHILSHITEQMDITLELLGYFSLSLQHLLLRVLVRAICVVMLVVNPYIKVCH